MSDRRYRAFDKFDESVFRRIEKDAERYAKRHATIIGSDGLRRYKTEKGTWEICWIRPYSVSDSSIAWRLIVALP